MDRLKDLAAFGVWFLGLAYIAMWAVTGPLNRVVAVDIHPEMLSPMLHLVGMLAALTVFVRLLIAVRTARKPQAEAPKPRLRFRRPEPTVRKIRARDHFGLRGIEQKP
jgi:hypothetical protein